MALLDIPKNFFNNGKIREQESFTITTKHGENLNCEMKCINENGNYLAQELVAYNKDNKEVAKLNYYPYKHYYFLGWVEILDDQYIGEGVAHSLFSKMEENAREEGLDNITAHYMPFGENANHTKAFYENHGFNIEFDLVDRKYYATKSLQYENTNDNSDDLEMC